MQDSDDEWVERERRCNCRNRRTKNEREQPSLPMDVLHRGRAGGWLAMGGLPSCAVAATESGAASVAVVAAGNSITALQVNHAEGVTILKLTLKRALSARPGSHCCAGPHCPGFSGDSQWSARNVQQVDQGELRSVNIVQVGDRTRLVLNLNRMMPYEIKTEGVVASVTLAVAQTATGGLTATHPRRWYLWHRYHTSLRRFRYRKSRRSARSQSSGVAGMGVRRGSSSICPTRTLASICRSRGKKSMVNFKGATLPSRLSRRLDATDFATPVTAINTQALGGDVEHEHQPTRFLGLQRLPVHSQFVIDIGRWQKIPISWCKGTALGHMAKLLNFHI